MALSQPDPDRRHKFLRRHDTDRSGGGHTQGCSAKVASLPSVLIFSTEIFWTGISNK